MYTYISNNENDTLRFAQRIASRLSNKDVIVLTGDLGSGKTKFTQGVLEHFGLGKEISSPTFTIVNEYDTSTTPLYHFDVYRLSSVDEFYAIGGEEYFENGICIVEWGEIIQEALPDTYIQIKFERNLENPNERILNIYTFGNVRNELIELFENLQKGA